MNYPKIDLFEAINSLRAVRNFDGKPVEKPIIKKILEAATKAPTGSRREQWEFMVITDSKNPDAEGKVFLYKFGKKIFDKIQEVLQPEFDDETPMNPFDFWKGADFKIKIRKVGGFVNYDKSEFDSPSEFLDGDDGNLEEVWAKQYKLQEFIQEDQFKSYDELKVRLDMVLGGGASTTGRVAQSAEDIANSDDEAPVSKRPAPSSTKTEEDSDGEEDDALSYFEKLANED